MITTLTGSNRFLIDQALKTRLDKFIAEHGDLTVEHIDGEEADYQAIYDSVNNLPFLASKKLTILRNGSANKDFVELAEKLMANLSETNELILLETKLDKRSSLYKLLKTKTGYHELDDLAGPELAAWLVGQIKAAGGEISLSDANYLIDLAGNSQTKLTNEAVKLVNYQPKVDRTSIDLLIEPVPQSTIFQLVDAVFSSNPSRALKIYDSQRQQKVEPQQIIAMLAWQLHILALIKSATPKAPAEIAREAKLNPFVVNKSLQLAKALSWPRLKAIIKQLYELDVSSKTKTIDSDDAIRYFILSIAQH
jgi:DNA polymerase III subunit delta